MCDVGLENGAIYKANSLLGHEKGFEKPAIISTN